MVVVFQEDDALEGGLAGQRVVMAGGVGQIGNLSPVHHFIGVEHPQPEASREKPADRRVDGGFRDHPTFHGLPQGGIGDSAVDIGTRFHGDRRGLGRIFGVVLEGIEVADGPAVGDDISLEAPLFPEDIVEIGVGAGGVVTELVVGAHHRPDLSIHDQLPESREVGFEEVAVANVDIKGMADRLGARVDGKVFGGGHCFQVIGIVALKASDELNPHLAGEVGIFAVGLMAPAPARITEDVDIGGPEGKPLVDAPFTAAEHLVVFGAGFVGDGRSHPEHQLPVPRAGDGD